MKTIWKYKLDMLKMAVDGTDRQTLKMPIIGLLIHVGVQKDNICLWCQVNTDYLAGERTFCVVGTGQEIPKDVKIYDYRGTVQIGDFVWHIFEIK